MKKAIPQSQFLKIIIGLFILLNCNYSATGQSTITESFDGPNFLPTGWMAVGNTNLWSRRTAGTFPTCANHSGAGMARFAARGAAAKTIQTIASPVIDLSNRGTNTPKVSLWLYRDNGSNLGDSLSIYFNTTASLTSAVFLGTIARYSKLKMPDTVAANGWYQYTFNVPAAYKSATNYFLLKGIGEAGYNIHIDDVQWEEYKNPCTGTPSPGTISATTSLICGGTGTSTLSLSGQASVGAGLSFQWKVSSSATGPFTNFGTNVTTISTGTLTASRYYKCIANCSFSAKSDSTTVKAIIVNPNANPVITVSPNPANYCQGSSTGTILKASSTTAISYTWTPSTGLNRTDTSYVDAAPPNNTNYTVTGTDVLGCTGFTTVMVTIRQAPIANLAAADSILCPGDSIRLTVNVAGGGTNTFLWTPTGQTTNIISAKPIVDSKYLVTVKNAFGCATILSKNFYVIPNPTAKFGYVIAGRKVSFYDSSLNAVNIEWDFGDGNGSTKSYPVYVYANDGTFKVRLISYNSPCNPDTLIKSIKISTIGIKNIENNSGITIFPNPVNNYVKIIIKENSNSELIIHNSIGEKVFSKTITSSIETIDMTGFAIGMYNMAIVNKTGVNNFRIIKLD